MRVRRLPGFRFEVQSPAPSDVLPRMDIAAFVGFAASGPLHVPVAVEDSAQFAAIFGADAPLAYDVTRGEPAQAYLAPAVRAFFRNGGRRCWVIRVADAETAVTNHFPIAGLLRVPVVDGIPREPLPAFAAARSAGSWSDGIRVSASLSTRTLSLRGLETAPLALIVGARDNIRVGDLLRLSWETYTLFFAVATVEAASGFSPPQPDAVRLRGMVVWFERIAPASPPLAPTNARVYTTNVNGEDVLVTGELESGDDGHAAVTLGVALASAPPRGSFVRVEVGADSLWLRVETARSASDTLSPPVDLVRVSGEAFWWREGAPDVTLLGDPDVELLTCALWARAAGGERVRLDDLGFTPDHARSLGSLPTDEALYSAETLPALWQQARVPRFPLAGSGDGILLPLLLPALPSDELGRVITPETALERDGLAAFDAGLFLDTAIAPLYSSEIMTKADFLRYQSALPRTLSGIHAALALEEVTLIAAPDAVHLGWERFDPPPADTPIQPPPLPRSAWWHHLDCEPPPPIPRTLEPLWENFIDCAVELIAAPTLTASAPDAVGTFTLSWEPAIAEAIYFLEEATLPDFADAQPIYTGAGQAHTIYGRPPGDYYYHVRVQVGINTSDWSIGRVVQVSAGSGWRVREPNPEAARTLLDVQRALLRMCTARGDLFALLALPAHFREPETRDHPAALLPAAPLDPLALTPPLSYGETNVLSYGALYHPWLVMSEEDAPERLRTVPPDGSACGVMARRALERGAWVAPANEPMRGIIALTPLIDPSYWLDLQDVGINLVRAEPFGAVALNADTLSPDETLRSINVRRLLMLLRRLALRLGANYVFEPLDGTFRRMVRRAFESRLEFMFARGAFAGANPTAAFQVNTISTPLDIDNGRFIVELKVAPSLPMRFVTIRLVQSGDRGSVTEEI